MNKQDIILELINVNKKYDDSYAVENFNLYVEQKMNDNAFVQDMMAYFNKQ